MKKYICSLLCLLLGAAGLAHAQSPDAVPAQGTIEIQVRGIPADDATAISGPVSAGRQRDDTHAPACRRATDVLRVDRQDGAPD